MDFVDDINFPYFQALQSKSNDINKEARKTALKISDKKTKIMKTNC